MKAIDVLKPKGKDEIQPIVDTIGVMEFLCRFKDYKVYHLNLGTKKLLAYFLGVTYMKYIKFLNFFVTIPFMILVILSMFNPIRGIGFLMDIKFILNLIIVATAPFTLAAFIINAKANKWRRNNKLTNDINLAIAQMTSTLQRNIALRDEVLNRLNECANFRDRYAPLPENDEETLRSQEEQLEGIFVDIEDRIQLANTTLRVLLHEN